MGIGEQYEFEKTGRIDPESTNRLKPVESTARSYKQSDRYETLFWKKNGDLLELVGRISREGLSPCIFMMEHNVDNGKFAGIAVYDCGELVQLRGEIGEYEYGPPFSPV